MKKIFTILTRDSVYVDECVHSILNHYPNDDIVIVDSDSSDLSYVDRLRSIVHSIDLIKNKNYMDGAIWHVYKEYEDYTNYIFLQDSTELLNNIDFSFDQDLYSVQYFNDRMDHGRDGIMAKELKKHTNLELPTNMTGLFGPMMICSRNFLDKAKLLGMYNVMPESKVCQNSMERVWGFVASHLGYNIQANSLEGIHRGRGVKDYKYIRKKYAERS
jgi:hypothetical protein